MTRDQPPRRTGGRRRAPVAALAATAAPQRPAAAAGLARWQPPAVARLLGRSSAVVVCVPTRARAVAVTVDDGPHAELTPEVLRVLERHGARATFFFLGAGVARHPGLAAAAAAAGHEIGNHGWADRPAVLQSRTAFRGDLRRTAAAVLAATGQEPRFVRPGSGWFRPASSARCGMPGGRSPWDRSPSSTCGWATSTARPASSSTGSSRVRWSCSTRGERTAPAWCRCSTASSPRRGTAATGASPSPSSWRRPTARLSALQAAGPRARARSGR